MEELFFAMHALTRAIPVKLLEEVCEEMRRPERVAAALGFMLNESGGEMVQRAPDASLSYLSEFPLQYVPMMLFSRGPAAMRDALEASGSGIGGAKKIGVNTLLGFVQGELVRADGEKFEMHPVCVRAALDVLMAMADEARPGLLKAIVIKNDSFFPSIASNCHHHERYSKFIGLLVLKYGSKLWGSLVMSGFYKRLAEIFERMNAPTTSAQDAEHKAQSAVEAMRTMTLTEESILRRCGVERGPSISLARKPDPLMRMLDVVLELGSKDAVNRYCQDFVFKACVRILMDIKVQSKGMKKPIYAFEEAVAERLPKIMALLPAKDAVGTRRFVGEPLLSAIDLVSALLEFGNSVTRDKILDLKIIETLVDFFAYSRNQLVHSAILEAFQLCLIKDDAAVVNAWLVKSKLMGNINEYMIGELFSIWDIEEQTDPNRGRKRNMTDPDDLVLVPSSYCPEYVSMALSTRQYIRHKDRSFAAELKEAVGAKNFAFYEKLATEKLGPMQGALDKVCPSVFYFLICQAANVSSSFLLSV